MHQRANNCVQHSVAMTSRHSVSAARNWSYGSVLSWLQSIRHQTFEYDTFVPQTAGLQSVRNADVKCRYHSSPLTNPEMSWLGSLCSCQMDQEEEEEDGITSSSFLTLKKPVRSEMASSLSSESSPESSSCSDLNVLPKNQQKLIRHPPFQRRRANPANPAQFLGRISEKSETSMCRVLTLSYADHQRVVSWPCFECALSIPDTCSVLALTAYESFFSYACVDQLLVWNDAIVWNQHPDAKVVHTNRNERNLSSPINLHSDPSLSIPS